MFSEIACCQFASWNFASWNFASFQALRRHRMQQRVSCARKNPLCRLNQHVLGREDVELAILETVFWIRSLFAPFWATRFGQYLLTSGYPGLCMAC
jgi:hypothetical protein